MSLLKECRECKKVKECHDKIIDDIYRSPLEHEEILNFVVRNRPDMIAEVRYHLKELSRETFFHRLNWDKYEPILSEAEEKYKEFVDFLEMDEFIKNSDEGLVLAQLMSSPKKAAEIISFILMRRPELISKIQPVLEALGSGADDLSKEFRHLSDDFELFLRIKSEIDNLFRGSNIESIISMN